MMTMAKNLSILLVLAATGKSQCDFENWDHGMGWTHERCPGSDDQAQMGSYCKKTEYTVDNCWDFMDTGLDWYKGPKCKSGDIEIKKENCGWYGRQEKRTCAEISVDWGCGCGETGRSCGCQCAPKECENFTDVKEICEDESFSPGDHCMLHVETDGDTCAEYCEAQGSTCVKAMDNDGICGLNWEGHHRQSTANNGCNQKWGDQICVCERTDFGRRSQLDEPNEEEPRQQLTSLQQLARAIGRHSPPQGVDPEVFAGWEGSLRPESLAWLDMLKLSVEVGESEDEDQ